MKQPVRGICLVPVGEVDQSLLTELAKQLKEVFEHTCQVGQALPYPWSAYDPGRDQYRAQMVLDVIGGLRFIPAERLLGVVDLDLYTPRLNFLFGLATMGGREAVIALPRPRQSFYSLPEDPALFRQRALKEAVHELGHTYGLRHCPDLYCVMYFSNSLPDTDQKSHRFCPRCAGPLKSTA